MKKRKTLGVFLLFCGLTIFTFFNYFNNELNRVKEKRVQYIEQKNRAKLKIQSDFYEITEKLARNQMRLNLENTRNAVEIISKDFNIDMTNFEESVKLLNALTGKMYFYDKEGDTFSITSKGNFIIDDSSDCGQPVSLINPSLPLLGIKDRERTFEDEIAWQYETKYILYSQGLIKDIPEFIKNSSNEKIKAIKPYAIDNYLNHVTVFKTREIQYIKDTYPEVFEILKKYRVVMHSDFTLVENVNDFFYKQLDSDKNTKLHWSFNPKPYDEILEIVWIPQGEKGFNNQNKNYAGGTPNPDYLKIGLVQGAQIEKIMNEYNVVLRQFEEEMVNDLQAMDNSYLKEKKNIEIMAVIISVLFVIVCFALIQTLINSKE